MVARVRLSGVGRWWDTRALVVDANSTKSGLQSFAEARHSFFSALGVGALGIFLEI